MYISNVSDNENVTVLFPSKWSHCKIFYQLKLQFIAERNFEILDTW